VNYRKSRKEAEDVVNEIKGLGVDAMGFMADVADASQVDEMVRNVLEKFGRIDVLVNNAGIIYSGKFLDLPDEKFQEMISINIVGSVNCARAVARDMIKHRSGRIVNLSSVAALGTSVTSTPHYSITKAAVVNMTKKLAIELGPYGILVNCIAPGFIRTEMNEAGKTKEEFEEVVKEFSRRTVLGRIAAPEEIASVALFLASDDSSFMTGQTLTVDGGRTDILSHSL
jgi:3-oxoacyl-[acyl-carrier protein] reductase